MATANPPLLGMTDTLTVAYIAACASLAAAIVALTGVLIGAWLNARFNRRLEGVKATFAKSLEALKAHFNAVAASRGLKHNAYVRYLVAVNGINKLPPVSPDGPEILEWGNALTALELVASPEAYGLVRDWSHTISDQLFNKGAMTSTDAWGQLRMAALKAMRDDLEKSGDPAQETFFDAPSSK